MSEKAITLRNSWAKKDSEFWNKLKPEEIQVLNSLAQSLS
jgi:hypothetical protein